MNREKIALIGYGYWGRKLYRYLTDAVCFDLRYVYFPSLKSHSRPEIEKLYGPAFNADPGAIWGDDSIASVVVATPIGTHFSLGKEALAAGKNLLIEKPLALTREEASRLGEMARRRKLVVMTDYIYTFSRALIQAVDEVRSGAIGQLRSIQLSIKQTGRFLEYDVYWLLASHLLAVLDMFLPLGKLEFRRNDLIRRDGLVESGVLFFRDRSGTVAGSLDVSLNYPGREKRIVIYGEGGSILYDPLSSPTLRVLRYRRDRSVPGNELVEEVRECNYDEGHNIRLVLEAFRRSLAGEENDNLSRAIVVTSVLETLDSVRLR
jgi:predicted dehydrogenase